MKKPEENNNISSAEMTAYWRSGYKISGDHLSEELASPQGIEKAHQFEEKYNYPLVKRKVSVRARFMLDLACHFLNTKQYDSCISFASGFSLLTYFIFQRLHTESLSIKFIDTDLQDILNERQKRIAKMAYQHSLIENNIAAQVLDLEEACNNNYHLKDIFPSCENPVFLIEGVIYFLSTKCVMWLIKEISSYDTAALIFDYWPEDGAQESKCFSNTVHALRGFMKESVVSFFDNGFWSEQNFKQLTQNFSAIKHCGIGHFEKNLVTDNSESCLLTDQNEFFPVMLYAGKTTLKSKL